MYTASSIQNKHINFFIVEPRFPVSVVRSLYCGAPMSCNLASSQYTPLLPINSSCLPFSTTLPLSNTYIMSACCIVLRRWAMAMVVRPFAALSRADCTIRSDVLSKEDVASSRRLSNISRRKREVCMVIDLQDPGIAKQGASDGYTLALAP